MHDDDLNRFDRLSVDLARWVETAMPLFRGITDTIPKLLEALQPLAEMAAQVERYEHEAIAALEDDFYNGRAS